MSTLYYTTSCASPESGVYVIFAHLMHIVAYIIKGMLEQTEQISISVTLNTEARNLHLTLKP